METVTKNYYLRKRLNRLLQKQLAELPSEMRRSLRSDIKENIECVMVVAEQRKMSLSQIDDAFISRTMRFANSDEQSYTMAQTLIRNLVSELRYNDLVHAKKEYTLELFKIKWVSKTRRRYPQKRPAIG